MFEVLYYKIVRHFAIKSFEWSSRKLKRRHTLDISTVQPVHPKGGRERLLNRFAAHVEQLPKDQRQQMTVFQFLEWMDTQCYFVVKKTEDEAQLDKAWRGSKARRSRMGILEVIQERA